MKEGLAGRVKRVISSGAHALVDAIEDTAPDAVLEGSLREIETVIADVRTELGSVIAHKHRASTRLMAENDRHEELSNKIEIAVADDADELASAAIEYQLDIEAQIPILEATIGDCAKREAELERYIAALQARKREMSNELAILRAATKKHSTTTNSGDASEAMFFNRTDARVAQAEAVFSDVMERATQLQSPSRASSQTAAQLAGLDDLARKNQVAERLSAIKQRRI